jgi:glycosyltransferase involved in cell wall biosynthesis
MQFHLLSFEGPDPYARAGGLSSRVQGLAEALIEAGHETHLWFVGDPDLPDYEPRGEHLHLHRWCQWISHHHPIGVYSGEEGKERDFSASLPPYLLVRYLQPCLARGGRVSVLAEEWHTANAVLHLDWLLRRAALRERVSIHWNANNTFGLERIDASRLSSAATFTTVSRYMRQRMQALGVDPIVIPNGLSAQAYTPVPSSLVCELEARVLGRALLVKVARWDPDKRWLQALEIVAAMRQRSLKPLLIARGGIEAYGHDVLTHARALGLRIGERAARKPGAAGLLEVVSGADELDLLILTSHVDVSARRLLFRGANAVLANSAHEPFGLVGLEAMAAGGLACTGGTGEDYATPGHNGLVLQTEDPAEFLGLFGHLWHDRAADAELRRSARRTSRDYAWPRIVARNLLPRLELSHPLSGRLHGPTPTFRSEGATRRSVGVTEMTRDASPRPGRTRRAAAHSLGAVQTESA